MLKYIGIFFIFCSYLLSTLNNLFADKLDIRERILANRDIVFIDAVMFFSIKATSYYHFMLGIFAAHDFVWDEAIIEVTPLLEVATKKVSYVSVKLAFSYMGEKCSC